MSTTLLLIIISLELLSCLLSLRHYRLSLALFIVAWCVALFLFIYHWNAAAAPPFGNMRQVMSLIPLVMGPIYVYVACVSKRPWLLGYFALTCLIAGIGAYFMPAQSDWKQMPALQSVWFMPHVASYIISYGLASVATLLTLIAYVKKEESQKFLLAAYQMVLLSFPFMSFGLWSGAIWADEVWGGYWSWDIKEAWSLITWGLYLMYLHLMPIPRWRNASSLLLMIAFVALLITFLVVNLLPKISSVHSYAS